MSTLTVSVREQFVSVVLRLTLLLAVLWGNPEQVIRAPMVIAGGAMLVLPSLMFVPGLWWALALTALAGILRQWYGLDNHQFLLLYWLGACALSLQAGNRAAQLRSAGASLLAAVFGFAVLWKLIGGEYLDGSFLYHTFLTDPRIQRVGAAIAGVPMETFEVPANLLAYAGAHGLVGLEVPIAEYPRLRLVCVVMSWGTLLLEAALSVAYVVRTKSIRPVRHGLVVLFVIGTYILLPVIGFAYLVALLAFAATEDDESRTRIVLLLLVAAVHLAMLPWQAMLSV